MTQSKKTIFWVGIAIVLIGLAAFTQYFINTKNERAENNQILPENSAADQSRNVPAASGNIDDTQKALLDLAEIENSYVIEEDADLIDYGEKDISAFGQSYYDENEL